MEGIARSGRMGAGGLWAGLAVVGLLGLLLRVWSLQWMLFDFDEGVAAIYALQFVEAGIWPRVGVKTSFEFYNPPFFIYAITPGFLATRDAVGAVGWLGLLSVGAWLALGRELWRQAVPVWAVVVAVGWGMFAPGPILYGRRLWGHALVATLGALAAVACLRIVRRPGDRWGSFLLPFWVALAQQAHFSGVLFGLGAGAGLLVLRGRVAWRWVAGGAVLAGLTYLPWLVHDWGQDWRDMRMILGLTARGAGGAVDRTDFLQAMASLLFDFWDNTAMQENEGRFTAGLWLAWPMRVLGWLLLTGGAAVAARTLWIKPGRQATEAMDGQGPARRLLILGLIWTLVPLVVFAGLLRVPLVPAYGLAAFPGPVLLLAGLGCLLARGWRRVAFGLLALQFLGAAEVLLRTHEAMATADPGLIRYPAWQNTRAAARHISGATAGAAPVVVSQEQLPPSRGLDFQMIYALALAEGNATRFISQDDLPADDVFRVVIHNRARGRLVPPAEEGPARAWRVERFGLLEVFVRPPRQDP